MRRIVIALVDLAIRTVIPNLARRTSHAIDGWGSSQFLRSFPERSQPVSPVFRTRAKSRAEDDVAKTYSSRQVGAKRRVDRPKIVFLAASRFRGPGRTSHIGCRSGRAGFTAWPKPTQSKPLPHRVAP